jgi:tetratricopeptide (TPR) repeat protein
MPLAARTFRIFVSSTFSDLVVERNTLQERVFPRLRELAARHGCRFQAIDLRWGVSEEAALDQQTMKICLGEIARCQKVSPRPNFIILIGDRYGWRPLPYEIPGDEYHRIRRHIAPKVVPLLEAWYHRDDNAVPPAYVLRPRTGPFEDYATWEPVEAGLHAALEAAVRKARLGGDRLSRYVASATEQEIIQGAFQVADAREHIFCFARETKGIPRDATARDYVDFRRGKPDRRSAQQVAELKRRLKGMLGDHYYVYTAHWRGAGPSQEHVDRLCEDVYSALEKVMVAEATALTQVDPLEQEIAAHRAFGAERALHFVGRQEILGQIDGYLRSRDREPLAIWGSSGSGKSALMARAVQEAEKRYPRTQFVYRFIGGTPDSSNGRLLLRSLCQQITRLYGGDESTIPSAYNKLVSELPTRLGLASTGKPLAVFLDAVDQLSDVDNARDLTWLPAELPPHVRLVVSTLPGECLQVLERKLPAETRLELKPMLLAEGQALLDLWLQDAGRRLAPAQRSDLVGKFALTGSPLYLKLAFEEAVRWHSYDGLPAGSDDVPGLGEDVPQVLDDLLWRLSKESNHGRILVERCLGYLTAAKNGLSEDELVDVLSLDREVLADFLRRSPRSPRVNRLPVVLLSRLLFDLRPYLTEVTADGTVLLRFYHRQLEDTVRSKYLGEQARLARHRALAAYFDSRDVGPRKVEELPWHLAQAAEWKRLADLLADWLFFEFAWNHDEIAVARHWAQLEANSPYRMTETYQSILEEHPDKLRHIGFVANLLGYAYHHEEAARLSEYLLEQQRGRTNPLDLATTLNARGVSLKNTGDLEGAMEAYREAEAICRNMGQRSILAIVLANQANILRRQGKNRQALSILKEAVEIARQRNSQYVLLSCLNATSLVYLEKEDYSKALTCLVEQEALCRQIGNQLGLAAALGNKASTLESLWGATPEELAALRREEAAIYRELGIRPKLEDALGELARLLQRQARALSRRALSDPERKEALIALYQEEERSWEEIGNLAGATVAQANRAVVMAMLGRQEAKSLVEQAYARAISSGETAAAKQIERAMDQVAAMFP